MFTVLVAWVLFGLYVAMPLLSLVCLAVGVLRRGQCSVRLLAVALVPPACVCTVYYAANWGTRALILRAWMAVSIGLLAWAIVSLRRDARMRRLPALLGLAVPAPFMVFALYLGTLTIGQFFGLF